MRSTGEMPAHLAEVYRAEVSEQTISMIADQASEGTTEWAVVSP